jgi:FG-GAP-like repeat
VNGFFDVLVGLVDMLEGALLKAGGGRAGAFFPFTISAAGGGAITTNPPALNFGNQPLLNASSVTNITVTNSGPLNATLSAATTFAGANQGDFAAPTSGTPCVFGGGSATVLTPAQNCTFGMTFRPQAAGSRSATLNIPNTGSPNPQTLARGGSGAANFAVPGDFDEDRKADIAVWRPTNGTWYVIPSKTPNNFLVQQWGVSTDIPLRGDFDGDGKTDFAVWRPSNGTWYLIPSSNPSALIMQQWGESTDIPVPGDYDGDGRTDFAVFRPSSGTWFIIPSGNPSSPIVRRWGTADDIPVPGDYDGDGKTDFAVFRPSSGTWFIIPSSNPGSPIIRQWGANGDIPVPGDYDGDGRSDVAVFRPSNGEWYVIPTSNPSAPTLRQWGTAGDIPVPRILTVTGRPTSLYGAPRAELGSPFHPLHRQRSPLPNGDPAAMCRPRSPLDSNRTGARWETYWRLAIRNVSTRLA